MIHLDDAAVADLLDLAGVTDVVGAAFASWGRGEAETTQRVRASVPGAMASAMAAVAPPFSGGKVYATKDGRFTFVNVLFDVDGRLLCTLDGDALTAFRTPAVCALAIRALARADRSSIRTAAIIGAGRQCWQHLEMLVAELPALTEVRVADLRQEAARSIVARAELVGLPAVAAPSATAAATGADIVITLTQSTEPLFSSKAIGDATLICAVGATKYDRCEIGADIVERCATVVCDDVIGSQAECGDLITASRHGSFRWERAVELRDVLAGSVTVRPAGDSPVLFETQGVALQDVAAAGLAWQRYMRSVA